MKKISFMLGASRKIISFEVMGRKVTYFDDIWRTGVQVMPKDDNLLRKLLRSGNPNLIAVVNDIEKTNSGKNLEEYNACKTEEDLIEMIRKDCLKQGLMEVK